METTYEYMVIYLDNANVTTSKLDQYGRRGFKIVATIGSAIILMKTIIKELDEDEERTWLFQYVKNANHTQ